MWLCRWRHPPSNFWVELVQWGLLLWLFCYTVLFSRSCAQVKPSHWFLRWMAQMTCFHPSRVLYGVRTMGDVIWGKYAPKTPQKREVIGSFNFKPKRQNLYNAISRELIMQPWSLSTIMLLWHSFLLLLLLLMQRTSGLRTEFRPQNALRE